MFPLKFYEFLHKIFLRNTSGWLPLALTTIPHYFLLEKDSMITCLTYWNSINHSLIQCYLMLFSAVYAILFFYTPWKYKKQRGSVVSRVSVSIKKKRVTLIGQQSEARPNLGDRKFFQSNRINLKERFSYLTMYLKILVKFR